jgi:hydrogenase nickel incorporation protein HypB
MENKKSKIIEINKEIFGDNEKLAIKINEELKKKNIFLYNILGTPGCGKTTFITGLEEKLKNNRIIVIEGDVESDIDTVKLRELGINAFQINTHGGCHLDAHMIEYALNNFDANDCDMIFVENVGNLICPAEFYLGEDKRILITSVTEGSDKPYKYPLAFQTSDAVIINKSDLLPYVNFDEEYFTKGIRLLNKKAEVFKISSLKNEGFDSFIEWLIGNNNRN